MKIMITGATGLIGTALVNHFSKQHELTLVGRSRKKMQSKFSDQHIIVTWDELKKQGEACIQNQDIIINLAGENIGDKRWSKLQKQKIIERVAMLYSINLSCIAIICYRAMLYYLKIECVGVH